MKEQSTPSPEYLKGFNEGYVMEHGLPELAMKLSQTKDASERMLGFKDGRKELLLTKAREIRQGRSVNRLPSETDKLKKDQDRDIER